MQNWLLPVIVIWNLLLTLTFSGILYFLFRFSKGLDRGNLIKLIDSLIRREKDNYLGIFENKKTIQDLLEKNLSNIQKIGLVKYNPFRELGGDHSFSVCILDGRDNGFILTGLHTRERTRIYIKNVTNGKCELEISSEEKKALIKAQKGK